MPIAGSRGRGPGPTRAPGNSPFPEGRTVEGGIVQFHSRTPAQRHPDPSNIGYSTIKLHTNISWAGWHWLQASRSSAGLEFQPGGRQGARRSTAAECNRCDVCSAMGEPRGPDALSRQSFVGLRVPSCGFAFRRDGSFQRTLAWIRVLYSREIGCKWRFPLRAVRSAVPEHPLHGLGSRPGGVGSATHRHGPVAGPGTHAAPHPMPSSRREFLSAVGRPGQAGPMPDMGLKGAEVRASGWWGCPSLLDPAGQAGADWGWCLLANDVVYPVFLFPLHPRAAPRPRAPRCPPAGGRGGHAQARAPGPSRVGGDCLQQCRGQVLDGVAACGEHGWLCRPGMRACCGSGLAAPCACPGDCACRGYRIRGCTCRGCLPRSESSRPGSACTRLNQRARG